ncbi:unnamed protein product [Closterium sp. Yama58-4]|nr:unnamed protein product [Closterium sp. Yama58-4]
MFIVADRRGGLTKEQTLETIFDFVPGSSVGGAGAPRATAAPRRQTTGHGSSSSLSFSAPPTSVPHSASRAVSLPQLSNTTLVSPPASSTDFAPTVEKPVQALTDFVATSTDSVIACTDSVRTSFDSFLLHASYPESAVQADFPQNGTPESQQQRASSSPDSADSGSFRFAISPALANLSHPLSPSLSSPAAEIIPSPAPFGPAVSDTYGPYLPPPVELGPAVTTTLGFSRSHSSPAKCELSEDIREAVATADENGDSFVEPRQVTEPQVPGNNPSDQSKGVSQLSGGLGEAESGMSDGGDAGRGRAGRRCCAAARRRLDWGEAADDRSASGGGAGGKSAGGTGEDHGEARTAERPAEGSEKGQETAPEVAVLVRSKKRRSVHVAAREGDVEALRDALAVRPGAINERQLPVCQTPLHFAVAEGHLEALRFLLEWRGQCGGAEVKADVEARNMFGETPVHVAAKSSNADAIQLLIQAGARADVAATVSLLSAHPHRNFVTSTFMSPFACPYACCSIHPSVYSTLFSVAVLLLEANADPCGVDKDGNTPMALLPSRAARCSVCREVQALLQRHISRRTRLQAELAVHGAKLVMDQLEKELSSLVGLHSLKQQLRTWGKGLLLDQRRRALGLPVPPRRAPHMAFLGSPGTGKTTVARVLARMLALVGVLPLNKVIEVQRTDLVGEYVGHTGPKTRRKIEEAEGGILFVDEAYRLMPCQRSEEKDYGIEALEEIMTVMDSGKLVVIFAGYAEPMQRVFEANEGFKRRVTKCFTFDDLSPREIARVMLLKMGYGQRREQETRDVQREEQGRLGAQVGEQGRLGAQVGEQGRLGAQVGEQGRLGAQVGEQGRLGAQVGEQGRLGAQVGEQGRLGAQVGEQGRLGAQVGEQGRLGAQVGEQGRLGAQVGEQGRLGAQVGEQGRRDGEEKARFGNLHTVEEDSARGRFVGGADGADASSSEGATGGTKGGGDDTAGKAAGRRGGSKEGDRAGRGLQGVEAGRRPVEVIVGGKSDSGVGYVDGSTGSGIGSGSGSKEGVSEGGDDTDMSPLTGFRLHPSCSEEALAEAIIAHTTAKQRRERNGGMAVPVLLDARDHLDLRLPLDCCCAEELMTIHMHDIEAALGMLPP